MSSHGSMVSKPPGIPSLDSALMTIEPPEAKKISSPRTFHGDTVIDEYAWLADKQDPDTISYLKAENAYTDALTGHLAALREQIFEEIKARTQESDLSVPVRKGGWWHYSRTVEGKQYAVHCRRAVRPGEVLPPMAEDGKPLDDEEVLLDGNELAAGHEFFSLGTFRTSPDQSWLAYSTDFAGNERFTLRIKDLATGATLPDEIPDTYAGCAWSLDGSTVFYTTVDDAWRPYRVWRHRIGTPAADDTMVFEEPDERFHVWVSLTRSESYVLIKSTSVLTSEVWLLDAARPSAEFSVVAPRRQGVDYDVEHAGDRLLILHNDGAENFEIATAPVASPAEWTPLVPHQGGTRLLGVDAFADYTVVYFRRDGLTGLRILRKDGEHEVAFGEPVYRVGPGLNPEFEASRYRLSFTSLVTPGSVYDCDMATGELTLLKRQPVLPSPAGVLARTKQQGSDTIVEAITKVQSIDLVADPATTNGLYEQIGGLEKSRPGNESSTPDSNSITIETITLEQLRCERPELICEIENAYEAQLDQVRRRLDEMVAKEEVSRRRERMLQLLQEFDLPLPESRDAAARRIVSDEFLDSLMRAPNDAELRSLVESRAVLVRSASQWIGGRSSRERRPKSKDQLTVPAVAGRNVRTAAEFAAAVCAR